MHKGLTTFSPSESAQKQSLRHPKNGLSHPAGGGVTQTAYTGVTHTDFEVPCIEQKQGVVPKLGTAPYFVLVLWSTHIAFTRKAPSRLLPPCGQARWLS